MFQPILFSIIKRYHKQWFLSDLSAGIIVGIVALPLAIAFSIASGVPPEMGLITAVVLGFLVSFFGGSRVQIGGPSGALIVVIYGIMQQFGLQGVLIAAIMAGIILIIMGLIRAGTVIQFMPYPIVVGFTSGIALIIFTGQLQDFFGIPNQDVPSEVIGKWIFYFRNAASIKPATALIGLLTMLITLYWHKVYRKIPGSLIGIITATALTVFLELDVETIGSRFGGFSASFQLISFSGVSVEMLQQLFVPAFTMAMLVAIESLLSAIVADGATGYRHRPNTELIAQGIANIAAPIVGGMGGSGALAKTMTNIRNGGKTPVAGMVHAIVMLLLMLFLANLAKLIPLSALAGVLVVVAYNMSEWRSFKNILKSARGEAAVLLTTFLLTIFIGLSFALPFGIILAMVLFINRVMETTDIAVLKHEVEDEQSHVSDGFETLIIPKGVEVFQIRGPFFFGIANKFEEAEKEIHEVPLVRIIRMRRVPFIDSTGLRNLRSFVERSKKHNTTIILSGVIPKAMEQIKKEGLLAEIGDANICENIEKALDRSRELLQKK